jgi:hypothetical protein
MLALGVGTAFGWLGGQTPPRTFNTEPVNAPPAGFVMTAMRQPSPGTWLVRKAGDNGYLAHAAQASHHGFGIALPAMEPLADVSIVVRLRLASGSRAAGVVWRYQNEDNHYQVVLDLAKRELAMFRILSGNRIKLEGERGVELDADAWHTLKIVHDDHRVRISLGGIRVFDEDERTFRSGRVGLLAAGDAEVWFDDLRVDAERRSR